MFGSFVCAHFEVVGVVVVVQMLCVLEHCVTRTVDINLRQLDLAARRRRLVCVCDCRLRLSHTRVKLSGHSLKFSWTARGR